MQEYKCSCHGLTAAVETGEAEIIGTEITINQFAFMPEFVAEWRAKLTCLSFKEISKTGIVPPPRIVFALRAWYSFFTEEETRRAFSEVVCKPLTDEEINAIDHLLWPDQ